MNNFYHKIALTSVCTALSFTLGGNKEVKAATFNLTPASAFYTFELNAITGVGDGYLVGETLTVGREWTNGKQQFVNEFRALVQFFRLGLLEFLRFPIILCCRYTAIKETGK